MDEIENSDWAAECERLGIDLESDIFEMARAYCAQHVQDEGVNLDEEEVREAIDELHETWLELPAGDRMSQARHDEYYDTTT